MRQEYIFRIVDNETGNALFEGTSNECGSFLEKNRSYVYELWFHQRSSKDKKIHIEKIGSKEFNYSEAFSKHHSKTKKEEKKAKPSDSKYEPIRSYDRVKNHLDIYGNTFTNKDPKNIVGKLNKEGYTVSVEYRPKRKLGNEIWREIYIITLVKKEKKNDNYA